LRTPEKVLLCKRAQRGAVSWKKLAWRLWI